MLNPLVYRWTAWVAAVGAVLVLFGCSSSSNKAYTLVGETATLSQTQRIVAATIDVNGSTCSVRIVTLDNPKPWTPVCLVSKDQATYKSLSIAGQEVDFGAVGSGTAFKVLSTTVPTLPPPPSTAPPASTAPKPAVAKGKKRTTPAPAASTAPVTPPVGPSFPTQWDLATYPGHVKLQGQNAGFLVTSATLTINGSTGMLDVTFKTSYPPLHLPCTVVADNRGDFTLLFNPSESVKISNGGNYIIQLSSEGQSITGNIWDSHGFDSWTPSLPPQWVAVSYSSG